MSDRYTWTLRSGISRFYPDFSDVVGIDTYVLRGNRWRLQNHAPQASWRRPHNPPRRRAGHAR